MSKKSSTLSQHGPRHRTKPSDITFTESMANELEGLRSRKIDLSDEDSSEITNWEKAEVGRFYRPIKKQITIRIDADLLDWFKHEAEKYQTLINQACREYMLHHAKKRK